MNYTSLRNWDKLTTEEKERLKYVYGLRSPDITKTLHDTKRSSLAKAKEQLVRNAEAERGLNV